MDSVAGIAITSFLVGLSGAMMPGPVLTVTIGETAARLQGEIPGDGASASLRSESLGFGLYFGYTGVRSLLV